jgi:ABC-2 type transport system ATP-binding protein
MNLQILEIKKRYGAVQAVDGISLTASPGKIYGLLGPNGAGKTTTIRMIMNIIAPDQGQILFDGKPREESGRKFSTGSMVGWNASIYRNGKCAKSRSYPKE